MEETNLTIKQATKKTNKAKPNLPTNQNQSPTQRTYHQQENPLSN